jgi:hypothetical protein
MIIIIILFLEVGGGVGENSLKGIQFHNFFIPYFIIGLAFGPQRQGILCLGSL